MTTKTIYSLLILILCINCSSDSSQTKQTPIETAHFPPLTGTSWTTKSLKSLGWKQEAVQPLLDYLELKNSKSFIILVNGHSATANWYWASAGKILTATLTGIAEQEGYVKIDNKVLDYIGASWTSLPSNKKKYNYK
jgi:hypothetical protein